MDVAFEVVDGDQRFVGSERERLGEGDADQQRSGKSRAFGHGNGVEVGIGYAGALHCLMYDRHDGAQVLARGQLRHNSAVIGVN